MSYRNRKLLNLAHKAPCFAMFPHQCTGYQGCEPAHADTQLFGRGFSHKTPDWAFASMCHNAHALITARINPSMDRETRHTEWLRAYVATQNWLWQNGKVRVCSS